jgi:hypothetical protein
MFQASVTPQLNRYYGVTVVLARGALVSEEFTARRNKVENLSSSDADGFRLDFTQRDFLLPVNTIEMDDEIVEPRSGDRVYEGDEVFEIFPEDEFTLPVERHSQNEWLVHTKQVNE